MAVAKTLSTQKTASKDTEKKKLRKAVLAISILLLLAAAVTAGIMLAGKMLFSSNPRFSLHEIHVHGTGYWKDHQDELAKTVDLQKGVNLFSLDPSDLRQKIMKIPNIDSCSVIRVLPDTLIIKVTERVPRAILNHQRSPWVVDSNAVIMPKFQVMKSFSRLPVITGTSLSGLKPGMVMKNIKPAVDLVMMTVRNFPDIRIFHISLADPKKLDVLLSYRKFPIYRVIIPVDNRGLSFMLHTLRSAIITARKMGEYRNFYDLSYDGKVVIRENKNINH